MKVKALVNLLLLSSAYFIYADNTSLFNQAQSLGQQHQFNLNLNANSNISTYSTANGFESTVASNANAGNANAQNMYGSANSDPNYLFNSGTQDIKNCEGQNDPRCSTLNKYLDKGTQATLQAYSQGVSERFYISVKPDPSSSSCSLVTRKAPINPTTATCTSSATAQSVCTTVVTPYYNYVPPVPADGTVIAQGSNQDTSKTYCGVTASVTSYETLTAQQMVAINVTNRDDDGGWNLTKSFNFAMNGGSISYQHQNHNDGNTNRTMDGSLNASCNGSNCSISFTTNCNHGQLGGNDWNRSTTVTLNYTMPKVSSHSSGYNIDDECSQQKASATCQLVNYQCLDNSPTKNVNGQNFNLSDMCSQEGLSGSQCCWNSQADYYCGGSSDTCGPYRKNPNCVIQSNTCTTKDYITGNCEQYQSTFSCASGYTNVESQVCTNVVCANNESGTANQCYNPKPPSPNNTANMASAIAYLQMGQNMAQDMNCVNKQDPSSCTLFSGKYMNCYLYAFKAGQPDTWNNNGADCMINPQFFVQNNVPIGYAASDRNTYSQATSGTNNVMGSSSNYSLSNDNASAINNTVQLQQYSKSPAVNQDEHINYNPNSSFNPNMALNNGLVSSVSINQNTIQNLSGLTSFQAYLSDVSVNLAWNRQKAEPNPNAIKSTTFADEGITRRASGSPFGWNDSPNQPVINGLCVHLADSCEGGDNAGTSSDLIKAELSWAGGFTNPNFCAKCTSTDPIFGKCLTGEPRQVMQQWCCFNSKVAMDINLAAYDQGLINFYTGGDRYSDQINHANNICGGVTVGMVSQIDFSKGNYFKDMMDALDVNQLIDNSNFTNVNIQNNTQGRSNTSATQMVNEWKSQHQ